MAMQYTFRELMPFLEEQLAKLSPEQRHAVAVGLNHPRTGWGATPEWNKGADALVNALKLDPGAADLIMANLHAARRQGLDSKFTNPDEAMPFGGPVKARSAYASDEEYLNAWKTAMGWESLITKPEEVQAAQEAAEAQVQSEGVQDRLKRFAAEMLGPVGDSDPVYRQLVQAGSDAAQASAGAAGLSGRSGLAGTQAASVAQQNVTPYLAQRQSLGLNALGTAGNLELGLGQLQQAEAQYMQNRNDLIAGEQWKGQQAASQGLWGTVGAVGGGILGAYFGGPQGAAMGAQAGYGAGSSLATLGQPSAPTYSSYKPASLSKPSKPSGGAGF